MEQEEVDQDFSGQERLNLKDDQSAIIEV